MIRTRFAPSPTGFMHIGNLRTALYEYLIAKSQNGTFILRIEDTDKERFVDGSLDVIYNTLKIAGLKYDEGPDIGGDYGPYVQSERKGRYLEYAKKLVEKNKAYYCFCSKEELDKYSDVGAKYDRHCLNLTKEEIENNLKNNVPYVIRQLIPEGKTTFIDEVYGEITVDNDTLDNQVLIKSDGFPTYNFANVIDDHEMKITHVIRGSEYLSSTPKYVLLYEAFNWEIPSYIHLPLILNSDGNKLSKRKGDASFEDLLSLGFLPEAIINYIALLGWSPSDNNEFFSLEELVQNFNVKGLSKSPSIFDMTKLTWMNSEYIKKMPANKFFEMAKPYLESSINRKDINLEKVSEMVQTRISFAKEIPSLIDFIDELPNYNTDLYIHKKMKTTLENSLENLEIVLPVLENIDDWQEENIHNEIFNLIQKLNIKNGQMLWPIRTALSGKSTSPCGAIELAELLGKKDSINRINIGIKLLKEKVSR